MPRGCGWAGRLHAAENPTRMPQPAASGNARIWKLTESLYPKIRGRIVPAEAFDEALRYRDEYRKSHPPAAR